MLRIRSSLLRKWIPKSQILIRLRVEQIAKPAETTVIQWQCLPLCVMRRKWENYQTMPRLILRYIQATTRNSGNVLCRTLLLVCCLFICSYFQCSQFQASLPKSARQVPLRQIYEVVRISAHCKVPVSAFSSCLSQSLRTYDRFWVTLLKTVAESNGHPLPEKSSPIAWHRAGENFERVALAGRITFSRRPCESLFQISWSPLKIEPSYRFARQYGHDRFCTLEFPGLGTKDLPEHLQSKLDPAGARQAIIDWLVEDEHRFLGRIWRAFFVKPIDTKKGQKRPKLNLGDVRFRIYFFAIDGEGFRYDRVTGERPKQKPVQIRDLIDWLIPSEVNQQQPCLKLFSRLALGKCLPTESVI